MLTRGTVLALVMAAAILTLASQADAAVCFQLNSNKISVELIGSTPTGFFSVAGELVSALGKRYPVVGGGRLQPDQTVLLGATAYYHEHFTACCEAYTLHFQGLLLPPAYNTGSFTVLSSQRQLTGPDTETHWTPSTVNLTPTPCP